MAKKQWATVEDIEELSLSKKKRKLLQIVRGTVTYREPSEEKGT